MTEQHPPQRPRRRVVLEPETPVPLAWGEDERLARPQLPLTPRVPTAAATSGRRRAGSTPRLPAVPRPGRPRGRRGPPEGVLTQPKSVLSWVVVALALTVVLALLGLVVSSVLLRRGMP